MKEEAGFANEKVRISHEGHEEHENEFCGVEGRRGKSDNNSVSVCAEVGILSVRRFTMWGEGGRRKKGNLEEGDVG